MNLIGLNLVKMVVADRNSKHPEIMGSELNTSANLKIFNAFTYPFM
jgi:hypothetical protein